MAILSTCLLLFLPLGITIDIAGAISSPSRSKYSVIDISLTHFYKNLKGIKLIIQLSALLSCKRFNVHVTAQMHFKCDF
jgi:hypothetical protein